MTAALRLRARSLGRDTYEPLPAGGLAGQVIQTAGAGTLEDPAVFTVTLTNTGAALWQGVVLAELVFPCRDPRFFLPGFLYGRNRGEAPLRVDTLFPRLRPGPAQKPAAPGWMVRGDQLSHPAAFALDGGRLYGISGGPYLVESAGRRRLWAPGAGGALHRFAGFTCSLEAGSVGHTLGYENAPWLFIQSHRVEDRPPLSPEHCLPLAPGETFCYRLLVYDLPARDPRAIYRAVEAVYLRWHQPPRTGLLYESWGPTGWHNRGWWFDGMHTAGHTGYLAGQSAYYLLKAAAWEQRCAGAAHKDWVALAGAVIARLNAAKNSDGEYPFILSEETGAGLEYDALGSAWCLAAAALYAQLTGDRSGLAEMERTEAHYYNAFIARAECYGGPLDTDKAVDSEGVLAYIRAVRRLHALTGRTVYLDHLQDALGYEFSFKFCYNTPIQTPPLGRVGWSSCGGSITSTANPHIHPMSSTVLDEISYLLARRPSAYLAARFRDTLAWSCQNHNTFDGEYDYGRTGWMSERFCYGQGLLVQRYPDGSPASTWFALMPWACASILEGLTGLCWGEP